MRQPLDRPLTDIMVTCSEYYLTNSHGRLLKRPSEPYKQLQSALTATLKAMAAVHAANYPGWTVDKDHAGYLIKLEAPMLFRVPYHILPSFPKGEELEALWRLSRVIRSGYRSVISISGSIVMRRIFDVVGDVDFCEYFPDSDSDGFRKIAKNMDGTDQIACLKLALMDSKRSRTDEWCYPWATGRPTAEKLSECVDSADKDRSVMKMDYIGNIDHIGVTEITNVMIAIDDKGYTPFTPEPENPWA